MHELSIAISLVEAAQEELEKLDGAKVLAIHLRLGGLAGVVRDSLEFSYQIACQDTPLEGSRLVIEDMPVLIECPVCKTPREVVSLQRFCCAICGAPGGTVVQGREIQVVGLEIEASGATVE